jgi:hypothetical protein
LTYISNIYPRLPFIYASCHAAECRPTHAGCRPEPELLTATKLSPPPCPLCALLLRSPAGARRQSRRGAQAQAAPLTRTAAPSRQCASRAWTPHPASPAPAPACALVPQSPQLSLAHFLLEELQLLLHRPEASRSPCAAPAGTAGLALPPAAVGFAATPRRASRRRTSPGSPLELLDPGHDLCFPISRARQQRVSRVQSRTARHRLATQSALHISRHATATARRPAGNLSVRLLDFRCQAEGAVAECGLHELSGPEGERNTRVKDPSSTWGGGVGCGCGRQHHEATLFTATASLAQASSTVT